MKHDSKDKTVAIKFWVTPTLEYIKSIEVLHEQGVKTVVDGDYFFKKAGTAVVSEGMGVLQKSIPRMFHMLANEWKYFQLHNQDHSAFILDLETFGGS